MADVVLYAFLNPGEEEFFLSFDSNYKEARKAKDPTVTFDTGLNSLTIQRAKQSPQAFYFTGCHLMGVEPGSTPQNPVYSKAALDEITGFSTEVIADRIVIRDTNDNKKPVPLAYQYTVVCQQLSDAKPFRDDPRIINQTGGGGVETACG